MKILTKEILFGIITLGLCPKEHQTVAVAPLFLQEGYSFAPLEFMKEEMVPMKLPIAPCSFQWLHTKGFLHSVCSSLRLSEFVRKIVKNKKEITA